MTDPTPRRRDADLRNAIRVALDDPRVTTDSLVTVAHAATLADQLADAMADTIGQELRHLRRWKAEALPVMDGLQELGRALGLPPGQRITGLQALAAVEQLQKDREHDARELARLREEVRRARVGAAGAQENHRRAIANLTKERNDARQEAADWKAQAQR